jgi:hypothetical protein
VPKVDEKTGQQAHNLALEYTRHLAMIENIVYTESISAYDGAGNPTRILEMRQAATRVFTILGQPGAKLVVPWHPLFPAAQQYGRPNETARRLISSYVRHVAKINAEPPPQLAGYKLYRIKAYRVRHDIPNSNLYAKADPPVSANHPGLYRPFYMGLFDTDGKLQDGQFHDGILVRQDDPLLYWMVPVLYKETNLVVYDYCRLHAGDPKWIRRPDTEEWVTEDEAREFIRRDEMPVPVRPRRKLNDD